MAGISGVAIRRVLETGTDRGLLRWQPMTAVASVMTVVHIFTSVDLGFRDLGIRMPIAFLSLAPLIVTVALAHRLADRHPAMRIPLGSGM
jgi:hypothetical protein